MVCCALACSPNSTTIALSLLHLSFSTKFNTKQWGVTKIHIILVIASKQGLEKLASLHPDVSITVGQVDGEVSDKHQVLPGIGDSSDRLFATPLIHDEDEELMHVSKRKRTMD